MRTSASSFSVPRTHLVWVACAALALPGLGTRAWAQAPAAADAAATTRSVGTVKSISGGALTVATDKGDSVNVTLPANVRVLQLAPGSTDLKSAQAGTVADINQGDRILVTSKSGGNGSLLALRVILMKSGAIAQNNQARQQDWQRRGAVGVVTSVDPSTGTLTLTSGARKITVTTTASTVFRRYAPGSVKFEDATLSKLGSLQPGDQARVRGDKSADGTSIAAEEVVSGAFRNIAGLITKVDSATNAVTVNDLATKKPVTIAIASDSDLRNLPAEMAARFAARAGGQRPGAGTEGSRPARSEAAPASTTATATAANGATPSSAAEHAEGAAGGHGGDLSSAIARLPKTSLADLKPGEAVMVVASGGGDSGSLTAITLLSGVEPLLASKGGGNSFSISPWNLGGEGGGEGAAAQ